jgi:uncharacterized YigZ family protein
MTKDAVDKFLTVGSGPFRSEIKVQGSRFISHILHASSAEDAIAKYEELKKNFHDATHNCFAYRLDQNQFRYSDDGEPSGTAGRPMFQVLEGRQILQVLAVVTRYFGGTKLGTGGLIRAYSDSVKDGLEKIKLIEKVKCKEVKITTRYDLLREVNEIISKYSGLIVTSDYSEKVVLVCQIPFSRYESFQREMIHNIEITEL